MPVLIASDFFGSVADLQANEQARVVKFVELFQKDSTHPSISLERVNNASDDLWSARVSQDLRAIVYKDGDTWALLHAGHHDAAYNWAERKQVGLHSVTGALQIVDVEVAEQLAHRAPGTPQMSEHGLFAQYKDEYLLSLGIPEAWLPAVRAIRFEDQLFSACEHLSQEVAERLLTLATGAFVAPPLPQSTDETPKGVGETRRFYVIEDVEDMRAALEAPLERWISFLHPSQRRLVDGSFSGPVKVTGSAGTGKTVVALHRAHRLAKEGYEVLVTTYVSTLKENLERSLGLLCRDSEIRNRIQVSTVHSEALKVVKQADPKAHPVSADRVAERLQTLSRTHGLAFDDDFVRAEWENVVLRQGLETWSEYRATSRTGRGHPLSVPDRKALWNIFSECRDRLREDSAYTWTGLCLKATELLRSGEARSPFGAVIVDEVQDLSAPEIRFLWALSQPHPERFMVVGDAGQRIYPGGFSLRSLGIEVRGRSHILRVNYRTTEQIRHVADTLLGGASDDLDGGTESRSETRSLFGGPEPTLKGFQDAEKECAGLARTVRGWLDTGLVLEDIAVFVRSNQLVERVLSALRVAGIDVRALRKTSALTDSGVRVGTMHRAKGLEFKAVAVVFCTAQSVPNAKSIERATDPQDREAAIEQERRLLYVAMTRARDELLVSWHGEPSPFLAPLHTNEKSE